MRKDIPEGASQEDMPMIGWGRINSLPRICEYYATVSGFGFRFFVATGKYHNRKVRWWIAKPNQTYGDGSGQT
jgi:hypothetical protein